MTCHEIRSLEEFNTLHDEWNALVDRAGGGMPFLRHEWLVSWLHGFGRGSALRILIVRKGGTLVAAAPFMLSGRTLVGLPVRALHFVGSNLGFLDFLAAGEAREALALLLREALGRADYDILIARGLIEPGAHEEALREGAARNGAAYRVSSCDEYFIDARGGLNAYRTDRSTKLWSNIRNRTKRLHRMGAVTYERHRSAEDGRAALREAFDVSLRSWKGKSGTAIGLKKEYRDYFERLTELYGRMDRSEIWLLRVNGRAVAYRIGLVDGLIYVELDIAYDEEFRSYSPGNVLAAHSNEILIGEGVQEINLGPAFAWKEEWSPTRRTRQEFILFHPKKLYPRMLRALQAWRDRKRRRTERHAG